MNKWGWHEGWGKGIEDEFREMGPKAQIVRALALITVHRKPLIHGRYVYFSL